jgi:hypothetical protein
MMPIHLGLILEKTATGKYNANISCTSADGKGHAFISILDDDPIRAIKGALEHILVITPNLTQEEIDRHYELYP